jgi:hypothetical protein
MRPFEFPGLAPGVNQKPQRDRKGLGQGIETVNICRTGEAGTEGEQMLPSP